MHENPVRVAEEVAMLDVISGGRIISGFVRGVWAETWAGNIRPTDNRERFQECHDLIVKAWTEPGPFRWEGKHYQYRVVNPWMVPVQKPHPPVWVPGSSSPETAEFAARRQYTYVAFLAPVDVTADLFDYYREVASEEGYEPSPDNFGYLICCYVGETEEEAQREAQHFVWRMGPTGRAPRHLLVPPGYLTESGVKMQQRRNKPLSLQSYQELQDNYHIVAGTPDQVIEKLWHLKDKLNMGHLIFYGQESRMSHEASMRNIDLFGKEVMPVVRDW
jgi:alkanesulfonate monooxygenase SsuD/methylene tetrahydromethanopterin reductase-like flavin-dependent oxidoreductase (luciferase family)